MSDMSLHTPADAGGAQRYTAASLAHLTGAADLSAGAAVAGPEGRQFRARLLADELAAGHCVMMRLAAKADYAIGNAAAMGDRFALPFDLLAARFAGTAGRLMDQFRRGALSLPKVAGPDGEGEGRWLGVCFENETLAPPEELDRRLAAAKADRATARQQFPDPKAPPPTPEQQAALERAEAAARQLAAEGPAASLAAHDPEARRRLFLDQVAAGHRMMMRLAGRADWQIDRLGAPDAEPEPTRRAALRLSSAVARLMERLRLGLLALERLDAGGPGGDPRPVIGYYWTGEKDLFASFAGGRTAAPANDVGGGQRTDGGGCPSSSVVRPPSPNRGRLKNGNPSGDYMAAPRCGAKTRAGCSCRQPAMPNGRCRFHGGKSTGPRTAAGLARSRTARLVHGFRSAEVIDLRKAAAATSRRLRTLLSGGVPAGHEVDRHVLRVVARSGRESSALPRAAARASTQLAEVGCKLEMESPLPLGERDRVRGLAPAGAAESLPGKRTGNGAQRASVQIFRYRAEAVVFRAAAARQTPHPIPLPQGERGRCGSTDTPAPETSCRSPLDMGSIATIHGPRLDRGAPVAMLYYDRPARTKQGLP